MAYISIIRVNDVDYIIKDSEQENRFQDLIDRLGDLAFKDRASGKFTPSGVISTPNISIQTSSKTIKGISSVGTLPQWKAEVNGETLSFVWSEGSLPQTVNEAVLSQITSATSSTPQFTGKEEEVSVS